MTPVSRHALHRICFLAILGTFFSVSSTTLLAMVNPCDTDYVTVDDSGDFSVSPSGDMSGDTDTINIQCASTAIEFRTFHALKLQNGSFFIKEIFLNCPASKSCTFAGTSKAGTIIDIVNNSIDCQGNWDNNIATGGLSFRGSILVQFMTVRTQSPCMGDGTLPGMLVFTGEPAVIANTCDNSILFASLNRVDLVSIGPGIDSGVLVGSQGRIIGGNDLCQRGLAGSFTSTRTSVDGPEIGASISMQSGARIGMDFFESINSGTGIWIIDAFAVTEINFCTIDASANEENTAFGIIVSRDPDAPASNTANINKCTFNLGQGPGMENAVGVSTLDLDSPSKVSIVITSSTFNHLGPNTTGVEINGTSNCTVSNNRFTGSGTLAIALFFGSFDLTGCTVTATNLASFTGSFTDLYGGFSTFDNIFGPNDLGVATLDEGCNWVLDATNGGCGATGGGPVKNGNQGDKLQSPRSRSPKPHTLPVTGSL